jgi:hypothetical protein
MHMTNDPTYDLKSSRQVSMVNYLAIRYPFADPGSIATQCISHCSGLKVLHLSVGGDGTVCIDRHLQLPDPEVLCSPWQVYREVLWAIGETAFSCGELQLDADIRDIQGPGIDEFEDTILLSRPEQISMVRFLVRECFDRKGDPVRLRQLWPSSFQRLRQRCAVHVDISPR